MRRIFTKIFSVVLFLVCVANANELDGGADAGVVVVDSSVSGTTFNADASTAEKQNSQKKTKSGFFFATDLTLNAAPKLHIVQTNPYTQEQTSTDVRGQTFGFSLYLGMKFPNHRFYLGYGGYFGPTVNKKEAYWYDRNKDPFGRYPFCEDIEESYDTYLLVLGYDFTPRIRQDTRLILGAFVGLAEFSKTSKYPEGAVDEPPTYSTDLFVYGAKVGVSYEFGSSFSVDLGLRYTRHSGGKYETDEETSADGVSYRLKEEVKPFGTLGAFVGLAYTF